MDLELKHGTGWSDDDLDIIIADYFLMLGKDLSGQPYVKSHHCAALMARLNRSHRSVEFKHQNISAVLDELGLPWIPGYIPKPNYQGAIFDAIDRYLSEHQSILSLAQTVPNPILAEDVFVSAPPVLPSAKEKPKKLLRLVRKFDPVERDRRNRSLGDAGEAFVFQSERNRLNNAGRTDLVSQIRWVSNEDGDGAGYDIHSFTLDGLTRLIEVKTTNGAARTPFFISRNEYELSCERPSDWCIYRVHLFAQSPRIFTLQPPLDKTLRLSTEVWRAGF
jgi:hypothetical protein